MTYDNYLPDKLKSWYEFMILEKAKLPSILLLSNVLVQFVYMALLRNFPCTINLPTLLIVHKQPACTLM